MATYQQLGEDYAGVDREQVDMTQYGPSGTNLAATNYFRDVPDEFKRLPGGVYYNPETKQTESTGFTPSQPRGGSRGGVAGGRGALGGEYAARYGHPSQRTVDVDIPGYGQIRTNIGGRFVDERGNIRSRWRHPTASGKRPGAPAFETGIRGMRRRIRVPGTDGKTIGDMRRAVGRWGGPETLRRHRITGTLAGFKALDPVQVAQRRHDPFRETFYEWGDEIQGYDPEGRPWTVKDLGIQY